MKIALFGAHRTGKTSLAKEFADATRIPFIKSTVSADMKNLNVETDSAYDMQKRLEIQEKIFESYKNLMSDKVALITDRSPLDFALYTILEVSNNFPNDIELISRYQNFLDSCIQEAKKFDKIYLLQPGIEIVKEGGKGNSTKPVIDKLNLIALGLASKLETNIVIIPDHILNMSQRVEFLLNDKNL